MKKILAVAFLINTIGVFSQTSIALNLNSTTLTVAPNSVFDFTTAPFPATNSFVTITLDIKNTSTTFTNTYSVKKYTLARFIVAEGDSANPTFCVGGQCYGVATKTANVPFTLNPLESTGTSTVSYYSFDIDLEEASKRGWTYVLYTIYNINSPNDSVQIGARYNLDRMFVGITEQNKLLSDVNLSPNPGSGDFNLKITSQQKSNTVINVYDAMARIVYSKETMLNPGLNDVELNLAQLSTGIYFVEVKNAGGICTKKLIIQ